MAELIKINEIKPHPENPRTHTEEQVQKIAKSIHELSWGRPIIISKDNYILAGEGAYLAAKNVLKYREVPFRQMKHMHDSPEAIAYMLADNKLNEESDWNYGKLQTINEGLRLQGFDVTLTGFENSELQEIETKICKEKEIKEDEFDSEHELEEIESIIELGEIYLLGNHRLMCGDSTKKGDVELLMDNQKVDMVFTDPPYGIDIVKNNKTVGFGDGHLGFVGAEGIVPANKYPKIIGDKTIETAEKFYNLCIKLNISNFILWGGNYFTSFLPPKSCWIIWDKRENISSNNFADCELAWTSFNSPARLYRHLWSGLLRKGNRKEEGIKRVHPTQKPVRLCGNIINDYSDENNIIYDGFGGSGTTLISCEQLNRTCYTMELDPHYCNVIIQRWEEFTGQKATKVT